VLIYLPPVTALVVSIMLWVAIGFISGYCAHRLPLDRIDHDTWLTRPREFEDEGRFYERHLRIRLWKDKVPEKGDMFKGGYSKRELPGSSDHDLERFAAETRRAEVVHWLNAGSGPFFVLWCGPVLAFFMLVVGAFHLPFVMIQRYNRARIDRTLARRRVRRGWPTGSSRQLPAYGSPADSPPPDPTSPPAPA